MKKFNLTALLLCATFLASCTAENAEAIATTEAITTASQTTPTETTVTAETTTYAATTESTEVTSETDENESFNDNSNGMTETDRINYLLRRFKDFSYDYISCKTVKEYVSGEHIEIEKYSEYLGENYTEKWYKVTDGKATSMEQLKGCMKEICTDKMIDFLDMENYYCEKDGFLYLSENAGNDGGVLGVDEVYIKSVEYPDESTVLLNMHAYGNAEYWELPEDFREDFTVTLKKSGNELLIDECDLNGISYITWVFSADMAPLSIHATEFATEQEYIDYLNGLDRTNETVVMSDDEFKQFIENTAPTAKNLYWLFSIGCTPEASGKFIDVNGQYYQLFLEDKCRSLDDLWTYMEEYYSVQVVENAKTINSATGSIIEHNGNIYDHEGEKGTAVYTYPERAEIVFQKENRITFSIPVCEGDADEFIRLCTISKNGDKWTYDQWFV